MKKRVASLSLLGVILLCIATTAQAEERVVPLKGTTVWRILEHQGCSTNQISTLWPTVLADSGYNPKEEKNLPKSARILIKRNCDGQLDDTVNLLAENNKLKATNSSLAVAIEKLEKTVKELSNQILDLNNRPVSQTNVWRWKVSTAVLFVLCLILSYCYFMTRRSLIRLARKKQEKSAVVAPVKTLEQLASIEGAVLWPKTRVVNHNGKDFIFNRVDDTSQHEHYYLCPEPKCSARLSNNQANLREHLLKQHANSAKLLWQETEEDALT